MTRTTSKHTLSGRVGTALLVIGSIVLVAYSAAMAWQFRAAVNSAAIDSLGSWSSFGLASLRVVRLVVLDHALLLSVLRRLLVLCSALLAMLIGIALLPKRSIGGAASVPGRHEGSALPKGDQ